MNGSDEADTAPGDSSDEHVNKIGRNARRGLRWGLLGNLGAKLGSFAIGLVLARLLSPADFGVYAVAFAVMMFATSINDACIGAACVQWRGKFEDMAPTATTIALLSSVLVYGVIWVGAPAFATFSGAPQATSVVRLLALVVVVDGIGAVRMAVLLRRFEQEKLTQATLVGLVANAVVAIPLGFAGAGAYSFAWGQVIGWTAANALMFKMGNLPVKFGFDRQIAMRLTRFGLPLIVSQMIESVLLNADYVIVGNVLGPVALGYYLLAFNVSSWAPTLVNSTVRFVSIPGFSQLAERGLDALQLGVRRALPILVSTILPIAIVMATLGLQLIDVVYGDKWGPAAVALRYLSVLVVVRVLTSFTLDIVISTGFTRTAALMNAGWASVLVPALWIGTHLDGIRGTAIAHGIVAVSVALPLAVITVRHAGISLGPALPTLIRPVIAAAISAAVIVAIDLFLNGNALVELFVAGGSGMIVYGLVAVPRDQIRRIRARVFPGRPKPEGTVM